jgi:hypothetical protein
MRGAQVGKACGAMTTDPMRAEHDAVLSALSTRESTRHFAHAGVSTLLAFTLEGTSLKLWHDFSTIHPEYATGASALGGVVLLYAAVRFLLGLRSHRTERAKLDRLKELRKALGVDAPASFSPQGS